MSLSIHAMNKCVCAHKGHVSSTKSPASSSLFIRYRLLSELQTNVCFPNHLSGTRAQKENRPRRRSEARKDTEKRQWGMREGGLTLYSWSLTSHEIGPEYQTQKPPLPPLLLLLVMVSPLLSIPALLISMELVSTTTPEEVGGQVWYGWGGWVAERRSIWMSDPT